MDGHIKHAYGSGWQQGYKERTGYVDPNRERKELYILRKKLGRAINQK